MSGGQAHRLALARALLHAFPVLVLDEPTADVDPDLGDALLRDLVATARAAGRTVVIVSHVPVRAGAGRPDHADAGRPPAQPVSRTPTGFNLGTGTSGLPRLQTD